MTKSSEDILREVAALSQEEQNKVREYISFLKWQSGQRQQGAGMREAHVWQYNLLEQFRTASTRSSENKPGMEVKAAEASVGGERRPALWAHPPISGEAQIEFNIPVPANLRDLTFRFAVGIREGTQPKEERLVAFRVRVAGWQIWSHAAWPSQWQPFEIALPLQAGDVLRLTLATDGLGDHQFAWAVWGEPALVGLEMGAAE